MTRTSGSKRRLPNWAVGLILIVVVAVGSLFAYTKKLPWSDPYEVQAVFETAQNLRPKSPVRIAGIQVGEVTKVEHLTDDDPALQADATGNADDPLPDDGPSGSQAALVTMTIDEEGLPLHEDATFQLRPRLFLEGNLFVDTKPGSPDAEETDEGHTFPVQQTSTSVQIDQVFTTLQSDVRANLQAFLDQFGNALTKYGGAESFRELFKSSPGAYKYTSQVNEALQGTQPHDLSGLISNLDQVIAALGENEADLQSLVTNFRIVTGSFAAESESLEQAIAKLPDVLDAADPAFANLNASFPPLRAFAREALPGVRSTAPAIRAATPLVGQIRQLVSEPELRGLVSDLRPTIPDLARLTARTKPFLQQARSVSSCFNEVVIPWSNDSVDPPAAYPHGVNGTVAEETAYGLAGIAGESRSGDANVQYIRVEAGGGQNTIIQPSFPGQTDDPGDPQVGLLDFPLDGAVPSLDDSLKTPFKPGVDCETQEQPDLSAGGIFAGDAGFPDTPVNPNTIQDLIDDLAAIPFPFSAKRLEQLQSNLTEAQASGDTEAVQEILNQVTETLDDAGKGVDAGAAEKAADELGLELGG